MHVGVPKESKDQERRAGMTPAGVRELVRRGHAVLVEQGLGEGIGMPDAAYAAAGACIVPSAADVFAGAELIVKVKELQPHERGWLRPNQILFAYLHLAPDRPQAEALLASGAVAIAYETVTGPGGTLPLLAPMSEIAGRMAVQAGAAYLESPRGGRGVLLGGVPGVEPGHVVVLGAGTAGRNASQMAIGLGARVTVLNRGVQRLRELDQSHGNRITTRIAHRESIEESVLAADLVIGAVLEPGGAAPRLVDRSTVSRMRTGAVVVDIAIDQGGCFETSRPTTHTDPVYRESGVLHYCVTNMPGAVARTSTLALTQATLPFVCALADLGWRNALARDSHLRSGLNISEGNVACAPVAAALGLPWRPPNAFRQSDGL
ncbi:alanine dehydrogenase [Variovorax sp. YR216]|uniref:alanine dehydrogenase n=1 Tax=Variovorax sp. YR216 TaxID=1882828 RepID=UPI0008957C81|nr:alanine dehydrogenase [Variovorax sp. YR216]SEB20556.1 L-alanine dehydrogenase [Variovorax sp. YR216]